MTDGEGAFGPFFFFAASRALRIASQRASICRLAGITRLSLRVMVGESAGSRVVAAVGGRGSGRGGSVLDLPRSATAATGSLGVAST